MKTKNDHDPRAGRIGRRRHQQGFNLLEILIAMTVTAAVAFVGIPPALDLYQGLRVRLAAQEIAAAMYAARSHAVRHNQSVGLKFRTDRDGVVTYALYRDGNGNGVRNKDVDSGVDPLVAAPRPLSQLDARVRFGFPSGCVPRHPSNPTRRLTRLDDPIRFNDSDLAVFTPLGTSTPGSVYLTDGERHLSAVRTYHRTGKILITRYDLETEVWL